MTYIISEIDKDNRLIFSIVPGADNANMIAQGKLNSGSRVRMRGFEDGNAAAEYYAAEYAEMMKNQAFVKTVMNQKGNTKTVNYVCYETDGGEE